MRRLLLIAILVLACVRGGSSGDYPSESYVEALRIANRFLYSWLERDGDAGLRLMAATLLKSPPDSTADNYASWLHLYISGLSNPHHQAFEIREGKAVGANRFSFPVTLYELTTGERSATMYLSAIELVHEADAWRVSRLPRSSDNQ